ncbi:MAG: ATP-binding protein [Algicola sp.]|nr:ATP-binding protein [Algicola sp.]
MKNIRNKKIQIIQPGQALMSLRDSGYSFSTAVAEVIDNSIEAEANNIHVRLFETENDRGKKHIDRVAFTDDGIGMSGNILHHYLVIGYSTRWMSEDSIGKYGVGAKLAALNFALKIECWSRDKAEDDWSYVCFDLDDAIGLEQKGHGNEVGVQSPTSKIIPKDCKCMMPKGTGTLVVWSKVDRLVAGRMPTNTDELTAELTKELGRIFRRFIDDGIKLTLNDTPIVHFDPLIRMEGSWTDITLTKELKKQTKGRRRTTGYKHFPATIIAEDVLLLSKGKHKATLTVTLYPREITRKRGMGGDELARKLRVKDTEGLISFVRSDREIAYTNVPRIFNRAVADPDRFIGIEISFTPAFDAYFGVRNVKRGVEPFDDLRIQIRKALVPYLHSARKMLGDAWAQAENDDKETGGRFNPVLAAVASADKTMPKNRGDSDLSEAEAEQKFEEELAELAEDAGHGVSEDDKDAYVLKNKDLPFVLETVSFPGKSLMDIKHIDKKVVIRLNTRHKFYKEIWGVLKDLSEKNEGDVSGADAVYAARRAVEGLTLMVIAFAKAQAMDEDPEKYEDLTAYWGQFTDTLLGKVKDIM